MKAFTLKKIVQLKSDRGMMIEHVERKTIGEYNYIFGSIARFTEIDKDSPWFNAARLKKATIGDIQKIRIPNELKPNFRPFNYLFSLKHHALVFEKYDGRHSISPKQVLTFLVNLMSDERIEKDYNEVSIDIFPSEEIIENILSMPTLNKIELTIKPPNSDSLFEIDDIEEGMVDSKIRRISAGISSPGRIGMKLSESKLGKIFLKMIERAGLGDGRVDGWGLEENSQPAHYSSEEHPHEVGMAYDPDTQTDQQAFMKVADNFFNWIVNRRRVQNVIRKH